MIPQNNDNLNEVIQSAKAPVIDKLEKALEINRDLVNENEKLKNFWNELCSHMFDAWDMDYDFFLTYGEKYGLLEEVEYKPEIHGEGMDASPGDMIFINKLVLQSAKQKETADDRE